MSQKNPSLISDTNGGHDPTKVKHFPLSNFSDNVKHVLSSLPLDSLGHNSAYFCSSLLRCMIKV